MKLTYAKVCDLVGLAILVAGIVYTYVAHAAR